MSIFTKLAASKIANELLLPQAVTAALELIINKALALNNNTSVSFSAVAQKTLTLKLAELSFPLSFSVNSSSKPVVATVSTLAEQSDCSIQTSLYTLKKLKDNQSLTQLIKQDELDVSGDLKVAQQFANIAQSLEIDWQSELANHLGDVPTHKLLQFGNKVTKSFSNKSKQLEADFTEYVVHEKRLVVSKSQIKAFNQRTKEIANDVSAISKRVDKLIADYASK